MFGRKSRKIAELTASVETQAKVMGGYLAGWKQAEAQIKILQEAQVGLKADRDGARDSVEMLSAERDQLKKALENIRTERLETEAQRFREKNPEVKAPSDTALES